MGSRFPVTVITIKGIPLLGDASSAIATPTRLTQSETLPFGHSVVAMVVTSGREADDRTRRR